MASRVFGRRDQVDGSPEPAPADGSVEPSGARKDTRRALRPAPRWRAHLLEWPLVVVVLAATALRVLAMVSYRPSLLSPDGTSYLFYAEHLEPSIFRPQGYSIFLRLIGTGQTLAVVPAVQHLLLVAAMVPLYVLMRSRGAAPWLAGLALVPLALDARQISIEHAVLTEALFLALVLGAVLLLVLPRRTTWLTAGSAGLLLGMASVVRSTGLPLLAIVVVFFLLTRVRWTLYVAVLIGVAVPVVPYAFWYHATFDSYALSQYDGHFLYGRVAPFADCRGVELTAQEQTLCETSAAEDRGDATYYVWHPDSPGADFQGQEGDAVLGSFARKIILAHPLTWARYTANDSLAHFLPGFSSQNTYLCEILYRFPPDAENAECFVYVANQSMDGMPAEPEYWEPGGSFLQSYQEVMTTPRIVYGLLTLLVLGCSVVAIVRRRWRGQAEALLFAGIGVGLVVLASATTLFDLRYGFQLASMMPVAGVLAVMALRTGRRDDEPDAPPPEPVHDTEPIVQRG